VRGIPAHGTPNGIAPGESEKMSAELHHMDTNEDNLVHLYQDITQCEEEHAKSVLILLTEVMSEKSSIYFDAPTTATVS